MSDGETANAWYVAGMASVAILLLPLVATPLTWVAVELLIQQAKASAEVATDTADTELHSRDKTNPPSRTSSITETAAKELQSSLDVPPRVDASEVIERSPAAVLETRQGEILEAEIYDVQSYKIKYSKIQSLNMAACAMLYAALMCFSLSSICCKFPLKLHALMV